MHSHNPNTGHMEFKLNTQLLWKKMIISEKNRYENVKMDDGIENTSNMLSIAIILLIMSL